MAKRPMRYRCSEGDVLDAICLAHYGRTGTVEAVLAINPGLGSHGPILPAGLVITLPNLGPATKVRHTIRLWD